MAGGDVVIEFAALQQLDEALKRVIVEFDKAVSRSRELEAAIGAPYGQTKLRDRANGFESGWDIRRDDLKERLLTIQERVEVYIREWEAVDKEMADPGE